ncbi:MAG: amidase [Rhizobiaceae bacterium]|nr:amidase [Rhizobiaceae bacterium]
MTASNDQLNAFVLGPFEPESATRSGPLSGLIFAVKDIFDVKGQRTGGGNPQMLDEAQPATETAPAVQKLLDAGASLVGRTQTEELTFSLMGQNAHFPYPINPAAPDRVTGGSSSGSAAAVAGGLVDFATGSDTGGSVRAPASFCGLIGLRTTHGAIPLKGAMPLAPTMDTFGWFAKDGETYERIATVLLKDGKALPKPRPLRLAALDELLLGDAEATEYERISALVTDVIGAPTDVPPLSQPIDDLYWTFRRLQAYEAWTVHGRWISAKERNLGPGVKERFEFGSTLGCEVPAEETPKRIAIRDELANLLGDDGVIVMPTVPGAAPLSATPFDEIQNYRELALRLLCLSGLSGFPQITIPLGKVHGAPFGISLLGPAGSDLALIRLARRIIARAEA